MTVTLAPPPSVEGPIAIITRKRVAEQLEKVLPPLLARLDALEAEVAALKAASKRKS